MAENTTIPTELVEKILSTLKGETEHWLQEWESVGRHPSSRYRREYWFFSELVTELEAAIKL